MAEQPSRNRRIVTRVQDRPVPERPWWLTSTIVLICVSVLVSLLLPVIQPVSHRPLPPAIKKLRKINDAVEQYRTKYGHFPHDDRGQQYALYELHPYVSADVFQLFEDDGPAPYWDHQLRQLQGGDVLYINQPLADLSESQLFLIAKPEANANWTWTAYTSFGPRSATFAATPDARVLGSIRTIDDLHVVGRQLYQDMAVTHVVSGSPWTTTWHNGRTLVSASVAGRSMRYDFQAGRLRTCTISTSKGTVTETFTTDEFGQITGVTRTPENWREIL